MNSQSDLALERAGFAVSQHNGGKHWVLKGRGIRADYWPTAGKFQVFGKVFRASVQDFIRAAHAGQYTKPNKSPAHCKRCGDPIHWAKTARGKWMPLDQDGGAHMAHCRRTQ